MVDVSVVVPTRNRAGLLRGAVESLAHQDFPPERFEVVIVDNGSTDGTAEVCRRFRLDNPGLSIRIVTEEIPGLLAGRHRGAREAKGEILSFVDDDIRAHTGWLRALHGTFERHRTALVGGRSLPSFEDSPPTWLRHLWDKTPSGGRALGDLSLLDLGEREKEVKPALVWGLNFSIRKEVLFEVGGFHPDCMPPHLQRYQGDGEVGLALKLEERGFRAFYQPRALVLHVIPRERLTGEYFDKRYFYQGVCDSYTEIRRRGGLSPRGLHEEGSPEGNPPAGRVMLVDRARRAAGKTLYLLKSTADERKTVRGLRRRMEKAYGEGYRFHQGEVRRDPLLLRWVLKEDYLDYRFPG
jgi:glycosyltransferase involved in cell wall biosynthesis